MTKEIRYPVLIYKSLNVPDELFQGITPIRLHANWNYSVIKSGEDIDWLASHISAIDIYKTKSRF